MIQDAPESVILAGDSLNYTTTLSPGHVYSLAVNTHTTTSGMQDNWLCYYDYYNGMLVPIYFVIWYVDVKSCLLQSYLSSVYDYQLWIDYKPIVFKKAIA